MGWEKPVNTGLVSSEVKSFSFVLCAMEIHERAGSRGLTRSDLNFAKRSLGCYDQIVLRMAGRVQRWKQED